MPDPRFCEHPREDFLAHQEAIEAALRRVFLRGRYILGEEVAAFEHEFAAWLGVRHAIGVASGSDAIELLLRAHGIGQGDGVAVPSHTAVACICAVMRAGAVPVLVDVDPATFTLLPESVEAALQRDSAIRAVLAVHLYGHPADMEPLHDVCRRRGILLLEDAAQAHGATLHGRKTGTLARGAAFSFYPTKNLGALGDGGAVTTDDDLLASRVRELREHGWRERFISATQGVNSRLDELQAAVLRVKLPSLDHGNAVRSRLAAIYTEGLRGLPGIITPAVRPGCTHAHHLYVIRARGRMELMQRLLAAGIPVARHYPAAVHQQPAYAHLDDGALNNTGALMSEILTLPLHPHLREEAVQFVVDTIRSSARS